MELELATTEDIARELRGREQHFVLIAMENTNRVAPHQVLIAGQAESSRDVIRLCWRGARAFAGLKMDE
jgi:hypothetical protein